MAADVSAVKAALTSWSDRVLRTAVGAMPDQMRPYAPIGQQPGTDVGPSFRVPGALRQSIIVDQSRQSTGPDTFGARIIAPVIQARTTDQGSPAHIIRPRKAGGVLIFQINGETVGARFVNHPGNAPHPWWLRALEATWGPNLRYAALHTPFAV